MMKENEVRLLLQRYVLRGNNTGIFYMGDSSACDYFLDMMNNGEIHWTDAPDAIVTKGEDVLLIEHFEFSCYKASKGKGSSIRSELSEFNREFDKFLKYGSNGVLEKRVKSKRSYQDYIDNAKKNFAHHYERIKKYKENALKEDYVAENAKIKVLFLIEDTTPGGMIIREGDSENNELFLMTLAKDDDFLRFFEDKCQVDYVLNCACSGSVYDAWLIDREKINVYQENAYDYSNCKMFAGSDYWLAGKIVR